METTLTHKGNYLKQKINGYSTEIGVLDSKNATSCYLTFGGYVKPIEGDLDLSMKMFERKLRFWVDDAANQLFKGNLNTRMPIIKNVEWSDTTTATNAARVNNTYTYFSIELTLFWREPINIRDENQADHLLLLLFSLSDYLDETKELSFKTSR